jgi:hypothetical protein
MHWEFCIPLFFHRACGMLKNKLWKNFEKIREEFFYTGCVDKFLIFTLGLWRKNRCGSKGKGTFPHKFLLQQLQLPE